MAITQSTTGPRNRLLEAANSSANIELTPLRPSAQGVSPAGLIPVCPQCKAAMTGPTVLGYCSQCGYCQALDLPADSAPETTSESDKKTSTLGIIEMAQILLGMPGWMAILILGSTTIVLYMVAVDQSLEIESSYRSMIGITLLALSFVSFLLCELWILAKLLPTTDQLGLRHLFDMGPLWQRAVRLMPNTRWPIWVAGWTIVTAIGSVTIIGGQYRWFKSQLPPEPPKPVAIQPSK